MPRRLPPSVLPAARQRHLASPYGRSHILSGIPLRLPAPLVPIFPQLVTLSDGSTFIHHTSSPRSTIRLTRDLTNNPMWNPIRSGDADGGEEIVGRLGRYRRKFDEGAEVNDMWFEGETAVHAKAETKNTAKVVASKKPAAPGSKK